MLKVKASQYSVEAANPQHEHEWKGLEGYEAPRGPSGDSGSGEPQDECAGASGGGRRPDHAVRGGRRSGERYCRDGLRYGRPYPSAVGLGKATCIVRRCRAGEQAALGANDARARIIGKLIVARERVAGRFPLRDPQQIGASHTEQILERLGSRRTVGLRNDLDARIVGSVLNVLVVELQIIQWRG